MTAESSLIAPCGMNCGICRAYLRPKKKCPGCRGEDTQKMLSCLQCKIKNCERIRVERYQFCFRCESYPCQRLKQLDKRYRTKYSMSMLENLASIKATGLAAFIEKENKRWQCPICGGMVCVHTGYCLQCGKPEK
jgi:hypothetical protein